MAIKPTSLPLWDTSETNIVVPGAGAEQLSGWATSAQPPSSYFNWFQNLTYKWLNWVNATSPLIPIARCTINVDNTDVYTWNAVNVAGVNRVTSVIANDTLRVVFTEPASALGGSSPHHVVTSQYAGGDYAARHLVKWASTTTYVDLKAYDGAWAPTAFGGSFFTYFDVVVFGIKP